ncbi:MAG: hypothetical protein J5749_06375 [Lachnospiraceae bacterium]|nr:hypothetical protein [Lachnospiraceae bacterium]
MRRFLATLLLMFTCVSNLFSSIHEEKKIDDLLKPYVEVIERVNKATDREIYIPEYNKEKVYNYYKMYTLEEFEKELLESIENENERTKRLDDSKMCFEYFPAETAVINNDSRHITEDIMQATELPYDSWLYLYSTVFCGGNPPRYSYQSINGISVAWNASNTGFHFGLRSWAYELSNNGKRCTVTVTGSPVNPAGLMQMVIKTVIITNEFD